MTLTDPGDIARWCATAALDDPDSPALWLVDLGPLVGISWRRTESEEHPPAGIPLRCVRYVASVDYYRARSIMRDGHGYERWGALLRLGSEIQRALTPP